MKKIAIIAIIIILIGFGVSFADDTIGIQEIILDKNDTLIDKKVNNSDKQDNTSDKKVNNSNKQENNSNKQDNSTNKQENTTNKHLGVGVIIGEPSGANIKVIFGKYSALDVALGWSFWGTDALEFHCDYLINNYNILNNLFNIEGEAKLVYLGLGFRIKFSDSFIKNNTNNMLNSIGLRFPFGASYYLNSVPIEFFVEVAFVLDLIPVTNYDFHGGIGARYYFF
jgi:hypothetical protein